VTFGVNKRNILETFILLKKISMKGKFKIFDKRSLMVIPSFAFFEFYRQSAVLTKEGILL